MKIKMIKGMATIDGKTYDGQSGAFEVEDTKGQRFIALGVAEKVSGAVPTAPAPEKETAVFEKQKNEKELEEMNIEELRAVAGELGLDISGRKKTEFIAAIKEARESADVDMPAFNPEGAIL